MIKPKEEREFDMDDLAEIIQIRWLIEDSGRENTAAMLAWFDDRMDLLMRWAGAAVEMGLLPNAAERSARRAKAKQGAMP
jgi:hypothetical protein